MPVWSAFLYTAGVFLILSIVLWVVIAFMADDREDIPLLLKAGAATVSFVCVLCALLGIWTAVV